MEEKRKIGEAAYSDFSIGWYLRKYTKAELLKAEILLLKITSHFEPAGEECGTVYRTLCKYCNLGEQLSDLALDLRHVPQNKDISETISWIEWIVSPRFADAAIKNKLTGLELRPIFDIRKPTKHSSDWHQLIVTGHAGKLAEATKLGRDPFSPSQFSWKCPLGHSVAAEFLSEVYLNRDGWDGSDISVTQSCFGQGRNLLRPTPLIIISQRSYRALEEAGLKGFSCEIAHLV